MNIIELDTSNRRQVRQWLDLPFRLYKDCPQWVPPLETDARLMIDRRRHPFFEHSEAGYFMAMEGDRAVGRIAVLDNRNFNNHHKQNTAFFWLFDCENNLEASGGLFEASFAWARKRGLDRITGPKGFTALDGLGLLVKGFEHRPALGIPYNYPYYESLVLAAGFEPFDDETSGYLSGRMSLPPRIHELAEKVKQRRGLHVPVFRTKKELRAIIPKIQELYNRSLGLNFDQVPLTGAEIRLLADQLLAIAVPRLVKIVMKGDDPIGFILAYPNITAAIQRTQGRILPFGWIHLLREIRRSKWVDLNGAGILPEYQGLGGLALLFSEMEKTVHEGKFDHAEVVQISIKNSKMQMALRDLGVDFYKVHRVYQRRL